MSRTLGWYLPIESCAEYLAEAEYDDDVNFTIDTGRILGSYFFFVQILTCLSRTHNIFLLLINTSV